MAKAKGYQGIVALPKAAAWGTAIVGGAGHGLEVTAVNVEANRTIIPRTSITGRVTRKEGDKGNIVVGGSILAFLRYEGFGRAIAMLFGTAGVPATVDTTARAHTFKIADSIDGLFLTLAYEILKDTTIFEFNSLKVTKIKLAWAMNGYVTLELEVIGMDFTDASVINTTTTIDTVTLPANGEIAQGRQMTVRINAQAGGALGAGDVAYCSAGEVTIARPLERDYTTEFGDRSSEPTPPEGEGAFASVTGSLTFTQYQNGTGGNSAFVLEQINRTLKKMDWQLVGDNLAGSVSEKFSHKLYFPMVTFGEGKPKLTAGKLGWQVPFESGHVSAAPTGFPAGHVDACTWVNTNQIATDALA